MTSSGRRAASKKASFIKQNSKENAISKRATQWRIQRVSDPGILVYASKLGKQENMVLSVVAVKEKFRDLVKEQEQTLLTIVSNNTKLIH